MSATIYLMQPEQTPSEQAVSKFENLHTVTPLSKYLAMTLFVLLPFLGGWVGYTFAPVKVVEVERVVEIERVVEKEVPAPINTETSVKHFLYTDGYAFQISTSSLDDIEGNVLHESEKQIYFYLPWFNQDKSALMRTEGSVVNGKYYFDIWAQESPDEPSYEWELAEYNPVTDEFRILLDSKYLKLDKTYNRDKAMSLAPSENLSNDLGHIVFKIILCTECGSGPEHYGVLNYQTQEIILIGRVTEIEWVDNSTLRYKTESEFGVNNLASNTKEYIDNYYNSCADHPITCYQEIDWGQIPWQEVSI